MLSAGDFFYLGEKNSFREKKKSFQRKKQKNPLNKTSQGKKSFSFFQLYPYQTKDKNQNLFFLFSFKIIISSLTRGYNLNFQDKITNQNGEHPLKGESILHQHLFLLLSLSFIIFLLFCLISYLIQFIFIFIFVLIIY